MPMPVASLRLVHSVPKGQRYSCHSCSWCCRWWRIQVEPDERERILAHDWAAESPRLRGVQLFEEQRLPKQPEPTVLTAQIDGACVFLEEDGLCLIHKVLGAEAKPLVCQGFPLVLGRTVEGVLVGVSYGCPSVIRNEGEPWARQEASVLDLLERSEGGHAAIQDTVMDPEAVLAGSTRLTWRAYRTLEGSILEILAREDHPAGERLAAAAALVSAAVERWDGVERVGEDDIRGWLEGCGRDGYAEAFDRAAGSAAISAERRGRAHARLIARVETAPVEPSRRRAAARRYAGLIARGAGELYLSTLPCRLELASLRSVLYPSDSPLFDDYLGRFLANFVVRKSLLEAASVWDALVQLGSYFDLAGWYALASAAAADRAEVLGEDVVAGIKVVEKAYITRGG